MAIQPTPPQPGEEPLKPPSTEPVGKPMTPLGPEQTLTPQEAAQVYKKVLVKSLLLQALRQLQKEEAKRKEISREDVYGG